MRPSATLPPEGGTGSAFISSCVGASLIGLARGREGLQKSSYHPSRSPGEEAGWPHQEFYRRTSVDPDRHYVRTGGPPGCMSGRQHPVIMMTLSS